MSDKLKTLEDFMKKYISNQKSTSGADSLDTYKHKTGASYDRDFIRASESLYAGSKKGLASYGQNYRNLSNKGLQNSGFAEYVSDKSAQTYSKGLDALRSTRDTEESKTLGGYASYLDKYTRDQGRLKESVSSHLISNGIVNLDDAVSYALSQGLSKDDAIAIGQNAYSVNKQKVFTDLISQAASLGLDKEGAMLLAKKMGVTDADAEELGQEIDQMMKHYASVSSDYLRYLEEKSSKTTNSF